MTNPAADIAAIAEIGSVPTILKVVSELTGLRFAAVARVTEDSWTACAVYDPLGFGLQTGGELDVKTTLCREVHLSSKAVIIENASQDPVYCGHVTPTMYGFESYISVPLNRTDGSFFGTICALDPDPAKLKDPKILSTIELFAELISVQLDAEDRQKANRVALIDERATAVLREQFIAVLGHDLRNPLASIGAGVDLLGRMPLDPKAAKIVGRMHSSIQRMSALINDVLDFARGRLGGGIVVSHRDDGDLAGALNDVVAETASAKPDRDIRSTVHVPANLKCDPSRLAQMLSNLLANALSHGAPDTPVLVRSGAENGRFFISVENSGVTIPPERMASLFQPYSRPEEAGPQPGLGLGLYICSEIAKAHGATLSVSSTEAEGTTFTFSMPIAG